MRPRIRSRSRCAPCRRRIVIVSLGVIVTLAGPARPDEPVNPREAVAPIAPVLPESILAAVQESRSGAAVEGLDRLIRDGARGADDRAFFTWIKGIALRRAGRLDEAAATLRAAMVEFPGSAWVGKLRAELAAVELSRKRPAEAERLARAEVEALLSPGRKDRLAAVVEGFAARLLEPGDPLVKPDPEGAYTLLAMARGLARGDEARARILLEMVRASRSAGNLARAIADLKTYLTDHPHGADLVRVRFELGEVLLAHAEGAEARARWSALVRDLEGKADAVSKDLRARSMYGIGRSYLEVAKGDQVTEGNRVGLGIAAMRRFLAAYPEHPMAVEAAYQVAAAERDRRRGEQALAAFRAFLKGEGYRAETAEARRRQAELAATATFQVGRTLQGQGKLAEAITAWKDYLANFPNGPQFADAQRAILDAQLAIADEHDDRGRFEQARAARAAFVAQNPLDPRVPLTLFRIGRSFLAEGQPDRAIAAWEDLIARFPRDVQAARSQWEIARIFEEKKADPARAIARLRMVGQEPWQSKARERIAILESKSLVVVTPRSYRSGEVPSLKVTTRNIASLTFSAYRLDAEDYFRKKHRLGGVESLDIDLVAPEHTWTEPIAGYAKYVPFERPLALKPIATPGAWVVKVGDEATLQAVTLVLVTDVEAIVKSSRDQVLVFAQDPATGRGRAGARVLAADGTGILMEGKTGADGVLLASWPKPRDPNARVDYLVLDGPHVAATGFAVPNVVAQAMTPRALIYTERPAYRPGQRVGLRGIVREIKDGQFDASPGATYRLEVFDSQGRRIVARDVVLSPFGTFHAELPLDAAAPVGTYRVRVYQPNRSRFNASFEVQAYRLAKAELSVKLPRPVFFRGEPISGHAAARYPDGTPMAGRPVELQLPDGRTLRGHTDAAGRFPFTLETEGYAEAQSLRVVAQLPEDGINAEAIAALAVRGFRIDATTARDVYLSGEPFPLQVVTRDATGEPTGQELTVTVVKRMTTRPVAVTDDEPIPTFPRGRGLESRAVAADDDEPAGESVRVTEREVSKTTVRTEPGTGKGRVILKVEDQDGGPFLLRVAGTDRFGNPVIAERTVTISGAKDANRLRLLADRLKFRVGETARVNLHNRGGAGTALVAWEADRILKYRLIPIKDGDNPLAWDVEGPEFPNVTLSASRMSAAALHEARLDLTLDRDLRVTIAPTRPVVGPGEEVELEVTTRDQLGRPVAAELAMAMVDRALLLQFGDRLPPLGSVFHGQTRTGAFATEATNTFRYAPVSVPLVKGHTEQVERQAILDAEADRLLRRGASDRRPKVVTPGRRGAIASDQIAIKGGKDPRSQAVLDILAEPIPMPFANETPLDDVLKHIKEATAKAGRPALPIYVDPVGLQEAERSLTSPVSIEMEGIPLRTSLRLALKQLGMGYKVEDGVLIITSEETIDEEQAEAEHERRLDTLVANGGVAPGMAGMGGMGGGMGGMMGGMGGGGRRGGAFPPEAV